MDETGLKKSQTKYGIDTNFLRTLTPVVVNRLTLAFSCVTLLLYYHYLYLYYTKTRFSAERFYLSTDV